MIQSTSVNFGDRLQASFEQVFGETRARDARRSRHPVRWLSPGEGAREAHRAVPSADPAESDARAWRRDAGRRALGSHLNPIRVLTNLVFWLVMFAVILVAANALGLESLANVFSELVSYIPSVIAAIVIILVGIVLGGFVGGLIAASAGALHGGRALARVGRGGVILLAIFMALQELGIATDIVTTAFAILFGAIALAMALSFGLGNRDLAGEVTREWYEQYRQERDAAPKRGSASSRRARRRRWRASSRSDPRARCRGASSRICG